MSTLNRGLVRHGGLPGCDEKSTRKQERARIGTHNRLASQVLHPHSRTHSPPGSYWPTTHSCLCRARTKASSSHPTLALDERDLAYQLLRWNLFRLLHSPLPLTLLTWTRRTSFVASLFPLNMSSAPSDPKSGSFSPEETATIEANFKLIAVRPNTALFRSW